MGHEFRHFLQGESRRLIWVIGIIFSLILVVQYFELPYGSVVSSLFYANQTQSMGKAAVNPIVKGNITSFDGLNATDVNAIQNIANATKSSGGNNTSLENDFLSERNGGSNSSLDLSDDADPEDESPTERFIDEPSQNLTMEKTVTDNGLASGEIKEYANSTPPNNFHADKNSSLGRIQEAIINFTEEKNGTDSAPAPSLALPPTSSISDLKSPAKLNMTSQGPVMSVYPNASSPSNDVDPFSNDGKSEQMQHDAVQSDNIFPHTTVPAVNKKPDLSTKAVLSLSEMYDLLLQSHASSFSMKPRWSSAVEQDLLNAKSQIESAPVIENDPELDANIYRNISRFKRSYELMEQTLKVYIYKEGGRPIFHTTVLKGIYASEGWFMKILKASKFVTKDARKAHLFYLPFSSRMLEETLFVANSHSQDNLVEYLKNYLDMIVARHNFWNRTGGADHFLVACHDWAPAETMKIMATCIRAMCNADVKEGFIFGKDTSLPETYVRKPQNPLRDLGGKPPSQRKTLAFFAGSMHGYLRYILLQHWENKDPDMKIFGKMRKVKGQMNYVQYMKSSKYCICAKGYEVNSPRVVEAIFYECVPVIISDNFIPPFFEILNWESFAVFVAEKDILNLKNILLSIPNWRYLEMQKRVKKVQQHFLWNSKPVKYDIFHMILHSIWCNRVFRVQPI
ncbi:Xylogalacturonan beta-1,3-xylosyltransferase [Bertholletia excelsa]